VKGEAKLTGVQTFACGGDGFHCTRAYFVLTMCGKMLDGGRTYRAATTKHLVTALRAAEEKNGASGGGLALVEISAGIGAAGTDGTVATVAASSHPHSATAQPVTASTVGT
jgi:hypothetical protein